MNGLRLVFLVLAGVVVAGFFYGGLWYTVRWLGKGRNPVLITLASFWIRTLVVLTAFVALTRGSWHDAAALLAGFTLGRFLVVKRVKCT